MSRIFYVSHDLTQPRGGIAVLYKHVAALREHGFEAFIVHATPGFRYPLAGRDIPVIDASILGVSRADVLVVPEDHPAAIRKCRALSCRKLLFCQNHFYVFDGLERGESWRDFGFSGYLCVSRPIQQALRKWFNVDAKVISPAVNKVFFSEALKPLAAPISVACMPRKGLPHLRLVQGLLAARPVDGSDVAWVEIDGLPQDQVAAHLRAAHIYVSTSEAEGLGLPPLEAMAAGCLVVGFAGGGGLDYARPDNGVWVADENPWALAEALRQTLLDLGDPQRSALLEAKRRAGREAAMRYSNARFERELVAFWKAYLGDDEPADAATRR
jgi:glycosyltransferase involved in cell wall biosynthesis